MNYLVTGGAGFIGSHIAEYLIDRGHSVTVVDNLFSGKKENIRHLLDTPHFKFVQGSITDPDLLNAVCHGTDGIFHQAVWFYCFRAFGESCPLSKVDKGMKVGTVVPVHDELKPGTLHGFSGLRR